MTAIEVVKAAMTANGVTQRALASRLNMKPGALNERLRRDNVSSKNLADMLRAVDYKIIAIPRDARVPKDGYEVW